MRRFIAVTIALAVLSLPGIARADDFALASYDVGSELATTQKPASGVLGCWTFTTHFTGYSAPHVRLFTFYQRIAWCGTPNGRHITETAAHQFTLSNWAEIPSWSPWGYEGISGSVSVGGLTSYAAIRKRWGKFKFCVLWVCQTKLPWVWQEVWADSRHQYNFGW